MNNRGVILKLLFGILMVSAALWGLKIRSAAVASANTHASLVSVDPSDVIELDIATPAYTVTVVRASSPTHWLLKTPVNSVTREMRDQFAAAMKVNHSKLDLVPGKISPEDVDSIYEKSLTLL